jgi:ankyrin repeat protein
MSAQGGALTDGLLAQQSHVGDVGGDLLLDDAAVAVARSPVPHDDAAGSKAAGGDSLAQLPARAASESESAPRLSRCARCLPVLLCLPGVSALLRRRRRRQADSAKHSVNVMEGGVPQTPVDGGAAAAAAATAAPAPATPAPAAPASGDSIAGSNPEATGSAAPTGGVAPTSPSSSAGLALSSAPGSPSSVSSPTQLQRRFVNERSESLRTLKSVSWDTGLRCIQRGDAEGLAAVSPHADFQGALKVWRNRAGESILHVLCRTGAHAVLSQILQDLGGPCKHFLLNVVRERERGMLPLHSACCTGDAACVKLLLANGALAKDQFDRYGLTPLHRAATASTSSAYLAAAISSSSALSSSSSSANSSSGIGLSALPLSTSSRSSLSSAATPTAASNADPGECARLLLGAGASPFVRDHAGYTSWHKACFHGNVPVIRALLEHADEADEAALLAEEDRHVGVGGKTGLHLIAKFVGSKSNAVDGIALLARSEGFDVNAQCAVDGFTPLQEASIIGNREAVLALLAAGADINRVSLRGDTALHMAIGASQVDVCECLLMDGTINLAATDKEGHTPKGVAVRQGSLEIVELINSNKLAKVRAADRLWKEEMAKQRAHEAQHNSTSQFGERRSSLKLAGAIDSLFSRSLHSSSITSAPGSAKHAEAHKDAAKLLLRSPQASAPPSPPRTPPA